MLIVLDKRKLSYHHGNMLSVLSFLTTQSHADIVAMTLECFAYTHSHTLIRRTIHALLTAHPMIKKKKFTHTHTHTQR